MLVNALRLVDFRNCRYGEMEFTDGVNVIFGGNAAGKTNILEAVFYFAAGKSFRGCRDRELIGFGSDAAAAFLTFSDNIRSAEMGLKLYKSRRREFERDGARVTRLSEYLGAFRAVVFTPDHLSLVKGQPENRRRFIDLAISQSYPRYAGYLSEYGRLLAQKNALLKSEADEGFKRDLLAVYNEKMSHSAGAISFNRRRFLKQLEALAAIEHAEISGGGEELALRYDGCLDGEPDGAEETRKAFLSYLNSKAETELARGMCLFGVHKDDFTVFLNGKNARFYASQGQQRSAVLSLKLAEGEMSRRVTGEYPVFLFDDILSELDPFRRAVMLRKTEGRQVLMTGCEGGDFSDANVENRLCVKDGKVEKVR